jgi:hypothetical protein
LKNPPVPNPHPVRALLSHLVRLLTIWKQISNGTHNSASGLLITTYAAVGNGAVNKFGICFQWRNEHLKPRMLLFSVGNSAMNSPTF